MKSYEKLTLTCIYECTSTSISILVLVRGMIYDTRVGGNYLGVYFIVRDIILYEEIYYTNVGNFKRYYIIL